MFLSKKDTKQILSVNRMYREALNAVNTAKKAAEEGNLNADQQGRIENRQQELVELINQSIYNKTLDQKEYKNQVNKLKDKISTILNESTIGKQEEETISMEDID